MGARPMVRLIQDTIRKALADELLFGRVLNGGKVSVDIETTADGEEEIKFDFPPVDGGHAPQQERGEPVLTA
jgi:ATP-dependent Clp protease ATP-binding subunit ClpA